MELFVLGTSQSVASISARERMYVDTEELFSALHPLRNGRDTLTEAVPLATCARLELYGVAPDVDRAVGVLGRLMAQRAGLSRAELEANTYVHRGRAAVRHLLRVAAGLESVVHGEAQILGQVREAAHHPRVGTTEGPILHRLFQSALTAGKRVRCETEIGRGSASLASASVAMLQREIGTLNSISALVLGAGDTGALMARLLTKSGVGRLVIANRTVERAQSLARELGAEACRLDEVMAFLPSTDLVVGAVTTSDPIITAESGALRGGLRPPKLRYFLDLAHPRNFDPALAELPGVTVFDLEHVFQCVRGAREARTAQVPRAEEIVQEEMEAFFCWLHARRNMEILKALRAQVMDRAMAQADVYGRKLPSEYREHMRQLARSVARELLHQPTVAIREADPTSEDGRSILAGTAQLFGLDKISKDLSTTS